MSSKGQWRIPVNGDWFYGTKEQCERERAEYESTFTDLDREEAGVVAPEQIYSGAPPELAELQAAIAKLRSELERTHATFVNATAVENEKWAKHTAQLQSEIERLKGGQGEPAAWANDQQLLLCSKSPREVQLSNPMLHNLPRNIAGSALKTDYCNTPLFASQPAPVSSELVQLLERAKVYARGPFLDEINACLDKVKELNQ